MVVQSVNYHDPNAPKLLAQSLKETGFAVINNHPIAPSLIQKAYNDWEIFFHDERRSDYLYNPETLEGYVPLNVAEIAVGYDVKDIKEFYCAYPCGRGQFPGFIDDTSKQLARELAELGSTILMWIENHTPDEIKSRFSMPLSEMIKDSPRTQFRINHFPPLRGHEEEGAVRAAEHIDSDLLTCLPAATSQGLQVKDNQGKWIDIISDVNSIVVNTGAMLQMCTRDYYKATKHRVCNPRGAAANESRYSMPLFLHPRDEVYLTEDCTAFQYWQRTMQAHGVLDKAKML